MNQSINTDSKNSKEPQQKYRLGTVSIKILGGLNRFYRRLTSPSASIMAQNIQLFKSHKKDIAPAPSSFFQFLYNLKINFLQIVLMGEGFPALFFFFFSFFAFDCLMLLKKDFEGLTDVFPL